MFTWFLRDGGNDLLLNGVFEFDQVDHLSVAPQERIAVD